MIAIIIALLFLRTIFVRRARAAQIHLVQDGNPDGTGPSRRVNLVVVSGGGWRDGGIGGIGFGSHYQTSSVVTR